MSIILPDQTKNNINLALAKDYLKEIDFDETDKLDVECAISLTKSIYNYSKSITKDKKTDLEKIIRGLVILKAVID